MRIKSESILRTAITCIKINTSCKQCIKISTLSLLIYIKKLLNTFHRNIATDCFKHETFWPSISYSSKLEDCIFAFSCSQACLYDRREWSTGRKKDKGAKRASHFQKGGFTGIPRSIDKFAGEQKGCLVCIPSLGPSAMQDPGWASTCAWHDMCISLSSSFSSWSNFMK